MVFKRMFKTKGEEMTLEILKILILWCTAQHPTVTFHDQKLQRECVAEAFKCVDRINPPVTARELFQQCLDKGGK